MRRVTVRQIEGDTQISWSFPHRGYVGNATLSQITRIDETVTTDTRVFLEYVAQWNMFLAFARNDLANAKARFEKLQGESWEVYAAWCKTNKVPATITAKTIQAKQSQDAMLLQTKQEVLDAEADVRVLESIVKVLDAKTKLVPQLYSLRIKEQELYK